VWSKISLPFALLLGLAPSLAQAHAILVESDPANGAQVQAGTIAMQFRFNSRIDRDRSRLTLTRPDQSRTVLPITADGPDDRLRTRAELTPGSYVVRWQVLATDGHITRGDVSFTVSQRAGEVRPPAHPAAAGSVR
jgi:copper resistance protein C